MSEHHELSPSKFPMWQACPRFDSGEPREAAELGTQKHEITASMLRFIQAGKNEWAVPEDIDFCVDFAREHIPEPWHIEERVEVLDDDFNTVYFGTTDIHNDATRNALVIADFKFGQVRDYYAQACGYAVPLMEKYGKGTCQFHVVFGAAQHVQSYFLTLDEARATVNRIIEARLDESSAAVPCDYCSWCSNRLTCPALLNQVQRVARGYAGLEIPSWHPSEVSDPNVIALFMEMARCVQTWADSVKHRAAEMDSQGNPIPGYIRQARNTVSVCDMEAAFQRSEMEPAAFMACCSVQIGKLADKYAELSGQPKAKARKELEAKLGDAIQSSVSYSIVKQRAKKEIADACIEA